MIKIYVKERITVVFLVILYVSEIYLSARILRLNSVTNAETIVLYIANKKGV